MTLDDDAAIMLIAEWRDLAPSSTGPLTDAGPRRRRRAIPDGRPAPTRLPGAPLVACHKSPAGRDVICAGWLSVEGHNHLGVQLLVIAGQILAVALRPGPGWPALVASLAEMVARHPATDAHPGRAGVGDEQPR